MDILKGTYTYTGPGGQKRHVPIERVCSFSQLHKGDHITIKRYGLYRHHAIVEVVLTGKGIVIVIEYSNYVEEFLQEISDFRTPGKAKVMRGNYRLKDDLYVIKHYKCLSAEDVVKRAQSRLEEDKYNLFCNNCEHFAMWCKTGISTSKQVKNIKEIGPPLVVGLVAETGEEMGTMVYAALNGAEKEALQVFFHYLPKGAQDMLLNGAQTGAMQAFTQYLANGGQIMLQYGAQIALGFCIPSLPKCGQAIMLNGREITFDQLLSQTISKGAQWVLKKVAEMAAEQVATQTSTTTRSLIRGAASGALVEGAIWLYDIYWAYEDLKEGKISEKECNDAIGKRLLGGVGSVTGATAGAAVGQLIPVPVVGSIAASVFGGLVGRLCENLPWSAKEIGPPLVVGLVATTGGKIVMTIRSMLNGAEKEALQIFHFHGAQTGAMQAFTQYLANGAQTILQYDAQIALGFCIPSLSKCRQAMMLNGGEIALEQLLSQSISKGVQWVPKKSAQMASKQILSKTVLTSLTEMLKMGPETLGEHLVSQSMLSGGKEMLKMGTETLGEHLVSQSMLSGGKEMLKMGTETLGEHLVSQSMLSGGKEMLKIGTETLGVNILWLTRCSPSVSVPIFSISFPPLNILWLTRCSPSVSVPIFSIFSISFPASLFLRLTYFG